MSELEQLRAANIRLLALAKEIEAIARLALERVALVNANAPALDKSNGSLPAHFEGVLNKHHGVSSVEAENDFEGF